MKTVESLEASMIKGNEEEEEKVDQIERVLGQFMFKEQGMSVEQAFKYHNKNADDGLDEDELKTILKKAKLTFTEREFEILMSRYDLDQSGGITAEEFQMTYRVQRTKLLDFVTLKDDQRAACSQVPVTIAFFFILLILIAAHDMTSNKFATETGIAHTIVNNKASGVQFSTISSIKDYWTWIEGVLLSQVFIQHDLSTGDALSKSDWGYMSRYNKMIGHGVEIAQARSITEPCKTPQLKHVYGHDCKPVTRLSDKQFGVPPCDYSNNKLKTKCWWAHDHNTSAFDHGGFTASPLSNSLAATTREKSLANFFFNLDYLNSLDVLKNQLSYYRERGWVDEQTVELIVTISSYNAEHGIFAQIRLRTRFERGGNVINTWSSESIMGNPYENNFGVIGLDVLWIVMVLALMIGEFTEMKDLGLKYLEDFWNVLDWTQCLLTIGIEVYWFVIVIFGLELLDTYERAYDPDMLLDNFNGTLATLERTQVAAKLDSLLQQGIIYRYLTVVNVLVLVIRFFKAFSVQPRLAVISKTLTKSVPDLAHFLVIFGCLFMTFVMFAHFVFGHVVKSYSDVDVAFFNTFRGFVAAPAINVPEIIQTNAADIIPRQWKFPMAEVWWVMFMVLLFLVVRSILLAIVLEAYKDAKQGSTHATTMWGQGYDMIRDVISGFRGVIRLGDVIKILEKELESRDRVNMAMILECYAARKSKSEGKLLSPKRGAISKEGQKPLFNFEESKKFSLDLVKEFFAFIEVRLPAQDKLRALSAFARISELDGNFNEVCGRIDRLEQKFGKIHDLLLDIKSR